MYCPAIRPADPEEGSTGNTKGTGDLDGESTGDMALAQMLQTQYWASGRYHGTLIHFPGSLEDFQALPGSPIFDSATLTVWAGTSSGDWTRYLEASKVTDPNADGMWKETETVVRSFWDFYSDPPHLYQKIDHDFYETDASFRYGGNPGLDNPEVPGTHVRWASPHEWGTWTAYPFSGVPADVGDHGPMVSYATLEMYEIKFLDLDVTTIFQDWIDGDPYQGIHLTVGLNFTEELWHGWGIEIESADKALGPYGDPTHAPKLTINYHYEGSSTADAGADMGSTGDATPRVKPGRDVTLDGSASTPFLTTYPIETYEWSWTYGTATHYIISTNDQSTAQLPMIVNEPDNINLTVIDELGLIDTDANQTKVTPIIPGDIDSSGGVNLTDFVILRNNFGQSNP